MTDSDSARPPRPRQVTIGSGMALMSCVLLVFSMLDSMPRMRSVEMRDTVSEALTTPPGSGLGIEVDTVLALLRVLVLVTGGLAAAGAVLAIFSLQRHHGARIGLSVVAVLLLVTATFVSGLLPLVVVIGTSMLWGREAREWFTGQTPRRDPHAVSAATQPVRQQPAVQSPVRQPPAQQPDTPSAPYGWPAPVPAADARLQRPATVTVAACLTWVFSAATAAFLLLLLLLLLVDQAQLLRALQDDRRIAPAGYDSRDLLAALWVIVAVGLFWCISAAALAVLAFRRVNVGRVGLVVSAVVAGILGVVTLVGLLHAMAAFATVALLFSGGANRWYAGTAEPRQPPASPQGPPTSGRPPVW